MFLQSAQKSFYLEFADSELVSSCVFGQFCLCDVDLYFPLMQMFNWLADIHECILVGHLSSSCTSYFRALHAHLQDFNRSGRVVKVGKVDSAAFLKPNDSSSQCSLCKVRIHCVDARRLQLWTLPPNLGRFQAVPAWSALLRVRASFL